MEASSSTVGTTKGKSQIFQHQQRVRLAQQCPWISICMIHMPPGVNKGHGHQHRLQLQQEQGPRHGPQQQLRLGYHQVTAKATQLSIVVVAA